MAISLALYLGWFSPPWYIFLPSGELEHFFEQNICFLSLLSNSLRLTKAKSKELVYASELKLFSNKMYRTNYQTNRVGFNDIFFFMFHLALMYACIVEKGLLWNI